MDPEIPVFPASADSDEALARMVAERLGAGLPPECVPGVAFNARLLARHAAVMRGEEA
ncbi:MAG: hypothetical protein QM690_04890 [Sphingobium sp.]